MLSDLPTDLHLLILEHDEEKKRLQEENEKLKEENEKLKEENGRLNTRYEFVKSIFDEDSENGFVVYFRYLDERCDRAEVIRLLLNAGLKFEDGAKKFDLLTILVNYRLRD